jgi:hypothetical protein
MLSGLAVHAAVCGPDLVGALANPVCIRTAYPAGRCWRCCMPATHPKRGRLGVTSDLVRGAVASDRRDLMLGSARLSQTTGSCLAQAMRAAMWKPAVSHCSRNQLPKLLGVNGSRQECEVIGGRLIDYSLARSPRSARCSPTAGADGNDMQSGAFTRRCPSAQHRYHDAYSWPRRSGCLACSGFGRGWRRVLAAHPRPGPAGTRPAEGKIVPA